MLRKYVKDINLKARLKRKEILTFLIASLNYFCNKNNENS